MTSPKFLVVFLFLLSARPSEQQINCDASSNCKVEENIAEIECVKGQSECTCKGDVCATLDAASLTYDTLDVKTCRDDKCTASEECKFWKYLKKRDGADWKKHCYLMDETQCQEKDGAETCPSEGNGEPSCRSGASDAAGCENLPDTTFAPPPTTESPFLPCPGPIVPRDPASLLYYQDWECYKRSEVGGHLIDVNMYEADSSMPEGGFCRLNVQSGSCVDDNPFEYHCKGNDDMTSQWTGPNDSQEYVENTLLKDVSCKASNLPVDEVDQTGRDIICVNGGINTDDKLIPAENECILRCDSYSIFSFYTDFLSAGYRADGDKRGWFYELMDESGSRGELSPGMLDCWGKR